MLLDTHLAHQLRAWETARAFYEKMGFRPTGESFIMDRDTSLTLYTMVQELE